MDNRLREALAADRVAIDVELVALTDDGPLAEGRGEAGAMAPAGTADARVAVLSVTDCVGSDERMLIPGVLEPRRDSSGLDHFSGRGQRRQRGERP